MKRSSSTENYIMKITRTVTLVMVCAAMLTTTALAAGNGRGAQAGVQGPTADLDLTARINGLAQMIIDLTESGQLNHGQAESLLNKLAKAEKALERADLAQPKSGDVSAQQLQLPIANLGKVVKALTDFLRELTHIITDVPSDVVQPIIDATLDLIDEIVSLLLP